jgi:hypothetical protein
MSQGPPRLLPFLRAKAGISGQGSGHRCSVGDRFRGNLAGTATPAVPTLDQESPGSGPGGATESAISDNPVVALSGLNAQFYCAQTLSPRSASKEARDWARLWIVVENMSAPMVSSRKVLNLTVLEQW